MQSAGRTGTGSLSALFQIFFFLKAIASRMRQVHQLNLTVKDLNKQLKEAHKQTRLAREAHLATVIKDSQNSSCPPSTDPRKRTRSLREKSGKRVGGQVGHRGATLSFVAKPDHLVIHTPEACQMCGSFLSANDIAGSERRQVHDLPRQKVEVTEHQVQTKVCGRCGMKNKAQFPSGCNAPAQYGAGVRGVAAYLMVSCPLFIIQHEPQSSSFEFARQQTPPAFDS